MPKPSCVLHEQDPDQGITQAFCLCDSTATLTSLSVLLTGHQSDSCAYTDIPATAKETITTRTPRTARAALKLGSMIPAARLFPIALPLLQRLPFKQEALQYT